MNNPWFLRAAVAAGLVLIGMLLTVESVLRQRPDKRSWRYISRILERWSVEGKGSGTHQRNPEKTDPDKYVRGKYGHVVQR